ncbi:hypothetical protein HPP92_007950 [Vanilla planifolia]|uniref:Uncharacterized protein n=1 Tax=Vanilla planifolia TaxID=51239 RepID=A0A835RDJ5_VANPL|nr:hypothetical protein HPP92_007950 [Vanilla planifolia]
MADHGLDGSQPVDLTKHPSGIVPTLQNIVSTVNLDCKLISKLLLCKLEMLSTIPSIKEVFLRSPSRKIFQEPFELQNSFFGWYIRVRYLLKSAN